ncbi:hypothetical protein BJL95_17770 [Methylomonas sp. LWB]|nr:hypothetical protein BJL95_17770 [Methylomonas sp. LWB]
MLFENSEAWASWSTLEYPKHMPSKFGCALSHSDAYKSEMPGYVLSQCLLKTVTMLIASCFVVLSLEPSNRSVVFLESV